MQYAEIRAEINKYGKFVPTQYFQNSPKDGGYTCAIIEVVYKDKTYQGIGFSKFNPNDLECPDTPYIAAKGKLIALGHAEIDIAEQVTVTAPGTHVLFSADSLMNVFRKIGSIFAAFPK